MAQTNTATNDPRPPPDTAALRLAALGIELPAPPAPVAAYVPVRVSGLTAFVSGQLPIRDGQVVCCGRLGDDVTAAQGYDAARLTAVNILAQLRAALGSLDRVAQVDRVAVLVACTADFADHPQVADGASDLLVAVFGESGRHARVACGVASLPFNTPVEIEAQVTLRP
ncbi:MAG: RidA family protein [Bifidobacteriaceae bacterium]|jgi:enamine deaminase RidA (YjgF/YER057c/UK114 family)|nr:RidA family protein [Bifidobacteriaceae bacterium]